MPDEPETITAEEAVRLLQIENGDRLAYLKIFQGFTASVEASMNELKRELAQYNASIVARNSPQDSVIPSDDDDEPSDDTDADEE